MSDITFDDLVNAKTATQPKTEPEGFLSGLTQDSIMQMGGMVLNILQEFKTLQGGKDNVLATRSPVNQTQSQGEVNKPMVDIDEIKKALLTVKGLKGDITISSMLNLLEENKEAVAGFLKGK